MHVTIHRSPGTTKKYVALDANMLTSALCLTSSVTGFSDDSITATRSLHTQRMESDRAVEHACESAALALRNALQLGTAWRHDAIVSRSRETKHGALPRGMYLCRGYPRTAWLSAVTARSRID